jgi:hypothetical protein
VIDRDELRVFLERVGSGEQEADVVSLSPTCVHRQAGPNRARLPVKAALAGGEVDGAVRQHSLRCCVVS